MKQIAVIIGIVALIALFLFVGPSACTQPERASDLLARQGYTDIEITGYRWLSCSDDDLFHTGFSAKSPTGQAIEGTVCAGWLFKGATLRFD